MGKTVSLPFSPEDIAESRKALRSQWRIEREDRASGEIDYHVWSVDPARWLFTIPGRDHANAKAMAERIVHAVNSTPNP